MDTCWLQEKTLIVVALELELQGMNYIFFYNDIS